MRIYFYFSQLPPTGYLGHRGELRVKLKMEFFDPLQNRRAGHAAVVKPLNDKLKEILAAPADRVKLVLGPLVNLDRRAFNGIFFMGVCF